MNRSSIWLKNLILMGIPTIISTIGAIISLVNIPLPIKKCLIGLNIALLVIFLGGLIWYSKNDQTLKYLKKDLEISNGIIKSYVRLFEDWANRIYDFAGAVKRGKVTNLSWDKLSYYNTIVIACSEMIKEFCNAQENCVSVNFVEYRTSENGEEYIEMVADSNNSSNKPTAFEVEERLAESKYYYADLIRKKRREIDVAKNNKAIRSRFNKVNPDTDLKKYSQYIAIPIFCKHNRLLGIFEVVTEYDTIIIRGRKQLTRFAQEKLTPYTDAILLVDKIHKGLYAQPE